MLTLPALRPPVAELKLVEFCSPQFQELTPNVPEPRAVEQLDTGLVVTLVVETTPAAVNCAPEGCTAQRNKVIAKAVRDLHAAGLAFCSDFIVLSSCVPLMQRPHAGIVHPPEGGAPGMTVSEMVGAAGLEPATLSFEG